MLKERCGYVPVVPERRRACCPLEANLDVDILFVHIVQVIENDIAFSFVESNDTIGHRTIDPQCFPSCGRVHTHERMRTFNVLWSS
jgi:hypothetical protein